MRSPLSESISLMPLTRELVSGLIVAQAMMACYLLALDDRAALLFAALCGIPVALVLSLLPRGSAHHYAQMAIERWSLKVLESKNTRVQKYYNPKNTTIIAQ